MKFFAASTKPSTPASMVFAVLLGPPLCPGIRLPIWKPRLLLLPVLLSPKNPCLDGTGGALLEDDTDDNDRSPAANVEEAVDGNRVAASLTRLTKLLCFYIYTI